MRSGSEDRCRSLEDADFASEEAQSGSSRGNNGLHNRLNGSLVCMGKKSVKKRRCMENEAERSYPIDGSG